MRRALMPRLPTRAPARTCARPRRRLRHRLRYPPVHPDPLRLYALAAPLAVDQASSFCASIVAAAVVARLGSRPLAALFLGRSLITLTGMSPVLGSIRRGPVGRWSGEGGRPTTRAWRRPTSPPPQPYPPLAPPTHPSAVETFSGAAHGAAERGASGTRAALGLVLQRALVLAAALSAGAAALWGTCARTLLVSVLGQDPGVAEPAARYVSLWAPALCLWGVSEACRRTAVVQGAVGACACVSVAVLAAAHPLTAAATRALGLDGADVADVGMAGLSAAGMAAVMLALDRGRQPGNRAWNGWSRAAMAGDAWRAHAGVAAPAAALICLIWWAGQATVLLAGEKKGGEWAGRPFLPGVEGRGGAQASRVAGLAPHPTLPTPPHPTHPPPPPPSPSRAACPTPTPLWGRPASCSTCGRHHSCWQTAWRARLRCAWPTRWAAARA